jgi:hypothetical protein
MLCNILTGKIEWERNVFLGPPISKSIDLFTVSWRLVITVFSTWVGEYSTIGVLRYTITLSLLQGKFQWSRKLTEFHSWKWTKWLHTPSGISGRERFYELSLQDRLNWTLKEGPGIALVVTLWSDCVSGGSVTLILWQWRYLCFMTALSRSGDFVIKILVTW